MKILKKNIILWILSAFSCGFLIIACGPQSRIKTISSSEELPSTEAAFIEETDAGCDVLAQEFGVECDDDAKSAVRNEYKRNETPSAKKSYASHKTVEDQYPLLYSSIDQDFPLRGSWRMKKDEIQDLVDRWIWSPEKKKPVRLLSYFDMVLLVNVARRNNSTPKENSPQRMQVMVRKGKSNLLSDWNRIHTWPISSGLPGGKRIATFTGVYKLNPSRLHQSYSSKLFDGADMYETMFLYHQYQNGKNTGVAIHGTNKIRSLGRRDSGGCIRLARKNSQCLFNTLTGRLKKNCLDGGKLTYSGDVPSFSPRMGEADPEYLKSGNLTVNGYKVLVAIFSDSEDKL